MRFPQYTEADIAGMLQRVPPHPDYSEWMKISSAVFSALPLDAAVRVLQSWSPEKRAGEYIDKHKHRLKQVGVGTLIMLAKQNGWTGSPAPIRHTIRRAPAPSHRVPRPAWAERLTPSTQSMSADDESERIASELQKLHAAGWIEDDTDARFYAKAVHLFKARFDG